MRVAVNILLKAIESDEWSFTIGNSNEGNQSGKFLISRYYWCYFIFK